MATITLGGKPTNTIGQLPTNGSTAPTFSLTSSELKSISNKDFTAKVIVLNIFPSIDTPVCATSVRRFNSEAANHPNTTVLCISADLPFAHKRFCEIEGINNVVALSTFRSPEFGKDYGVLITEGPLKGLLARAIVIIDTESKVCYSELVGEIGSDPNFEAALKAVTSCGG
ncbi:MAG: thiol peroxidase [Proteobacteria bacterium]|nr:thiol peroxidase [Desulfobulbaceae bacterium]MBU4152264.1 thiol peroxidase [Pseudomonadota bacterium]